jgi:ABC-2 type transport system permease protein
VTAELGHMTARAALTPVPLWSRIYGFGSLYAKTLRDSRLAVIILSGILGGVMLAGGAAYSEYATAAARADFAKLIGSLPPVMAGLYGNPRPAHLETLGGLISFKNMASVAVIAALWSILALSSTLATESRRGSLDLVAVTPRGLRGIALEKLTAHLTGIGIVMAVVAATSWLACSIFAVLPGDAISAVAAIGFALWAGLIALAFGSVAFALAPLVGRASAAGIAGALLIAAHLVNGYQAAVPVFAGPANATPFGWTVGHQPLGGEFDWLSLVPVALVAVILFTVGVELFARRDLGITSTIPWPGLPAATLGLRGPASRSFGERLPLALAWGTGIGLEGLFMGAAAGSLATQLGTVSPESLTLLRTLFPKIDLLSPGGFLQLAFVAIGFILVGFAAATLVSGWASDETSGRLEMLLATPLQHARWAVSSGIGVFAAVGAMTVLLAIGIGVGAATSGGDAVTPMLGTIVMGLYAAALAGVGLAVGGLVGTGIAAESVAALVIAMFLLDLVAPALRLPDWVNQLALTAHLGQPMIGAWDPSGIAACLVLALGGLILSGWGMSRRDVAA